jgi:predicted dehydrogenase
MRDRVRLAVVGVGRIGALHALHARELAAESDGIELAALVDADVERARALARSWAAICGFSAASRSSPTPEGRAPP